VSDYVCVRMRVCVSVCVRTLDFTFDRHYVNGNGNGNVECRMWIVE